ncbi:TVP38/TMEM64 family protein [Thiolapillus brandeum]|uniref:TVP38/TMEM64 family protein n=1 Tax=Thiolapillus brandeum TaxID=1076588 RepID=UPI0011863836|nr:VTT domain-containing protein [Thiolapillus brandeum]
MPYGYWKWPYIPARQSANGKAAFFNNLSRQARVDYADTWIWFVHSREGKVKLHFLARGLLLIAGILVLAWLLGDMLGKDWIDANIRNHGLRGQVLFLALSSLFVAVGLSRQFVAILAGYGFGFAYGVLLVEIASIMGCLVAFYYARWFSADMIAAHYPDKIRRIDDFIERSPFTKTLMIRLFPVGSNLVVNLAAGISRIPVLPFLMGSAIGYLPQNIVFALVGSGISVDPVLRMGLGALLFVISGLLGMYLLQRYRNEKIVVSLADEEEAVS